MEDTKNIQEKKDMQEAKVTEETKNIKEQKKLKNFGKTRVIFVTALILLIGAAVVLRLNYKPEEALTSISAVDTMTAGKGDIYSSVSVSGTVLPIDTVAVVCKISDGGTVKKIYVKNGDYVNEGDPICELDNQKKIDAAFIEYDTAKKAYDRMKVLYDRGDISKQDYEQVKAKYDGAKLAYDSQVEFATPTATADGYVENTNMTENLGVDYKDVLCYITSTKGNEIQFGVTERAIRGISLGDNVVIEKAGKNYNAIVTDKASLISSSTGLFNIKAKIIDNNDLAQGSMAKVTAIYAESLNTLIVPRSVVYYENEKPLLYYLDNENKVRVAHLTTGLETDDELEVISGIDENTKIISTWNSDLVDGTEVKPINSTKYEPIKKVGRKNNKKEKIKIERKSTPSISKMRESTPSMPKFDGEFKMPPIEKFEGNRERKNNGREDFKPPFSMREKIKASNSEIKGAKIEETKIAETTTKKIEEKIVPETTKQIEKETTEVTETSSVSIR